MKCYFANGLSWSFWVISLNLTNPWHTFMSKCKQLKRQYPRPLQAILYMLSKKKRRHVCQWQNLISWSLSSTKSDMGIYIHTSIVNLLFYRVISPTSKHSFRITTPSFPIFARQHLCFRLFMSICIKLNCFTYVTC